MLEKVFRLIKMSAAKKKATYPVSTGSVAISKEINVQWEGPQATLTYLGEEIGPTGAPSVLVCLKGRGKMQLQTGKVHVHGYQLLSEEAWIPFESPPWTSWITVEMEKGSRLVLVSMYIHEGPETAPSFAIQNASDPSSKPTIVPRSWSDTATLILQDLTQYKTENAVAVHLESLDDTSPSDPGFITAITGAKGVGKSTCLRYMVHRMLAQCEMVAVLDVDTGQPEFTPPGMLSLCLVHKPLLSPPHLHMSSEGEDDYPTILESIFWGTNTSQSHPSKYLDAVAHLLQTYEEFLTESPRTPLLVNMDGWVKGFGGQVLQANLQQIRDLRHVIQINGDTRSRSFELGVPCDGAWTAHEVSTFLEEKDYNVQTLSISARSLRDLRICTYFAGDLRSLNFNHEGIHDPEHRIALKLASDIPYVVSVDDLTIQISMSERMMPDEIVFPALCASIVGLCEKISGDDTIQGTVKQVCHGLGIVRSVDRVKRLLYILTPISIDRLHNVNTIVHGAIMLPTVCTYRGKLSESFPYMCFGDSPDHLIGSAEMASRNNIYRKQVSM